MKYVVAALVVVNSIHASPIEHASALIPTVGDLGSLSGEFFAIAEDRHHISGDGQDALSWSSNSEALNAPGNPDVSEILDNLKHLAQALQLPQSAPITELNEALGQFQSSANVAELGLPGMDSLSSVTSFFTQLSSILQTVQLPANPTLGDVFSKLSSLQSGRVNSRSRRLVFRGVSGLAGVPGASEVLADLTTLNDKFQLNPDFALSDVLSLIKTIEIVSGMGLPTLPGLPDAKKLLQNLSTLQTANNIPGTLKFGELLRLLKTPA